MRYTLQAMLLLASCLSSEHMRAHGPEHGTNQLSGRIVDAETNRGIAYAVVQIEGTTLGTATDTAGFYSLPRLPEGRPITAVASAVGYDRHKQTVALAAGQQARLDFRLRSTAVMEQIVVTADRQATKRTEAPTVVNVLSSKLFDQTSSGNIADALGYVSGLRMEYTCSNCGTSQIRINGLEGQYSQILLDSRPVFSSLAAVYGLEQLPAGMVDRVEVIRGGGSALYGSNAIAGVVNIITKEPHRNSVSLANTTGFTESGTADVNTSLNASMLSDDRRAGAYLFASVRNRDNYDRNEDGFSDIPKVASQIAGFRAYYKTGAYSKLTFEYHHINDFRRGGDHLERPPHESDITEQARHSINGGGLQFDLYTPNQRHKIGVYASYQDVRRESYYGTDKNPDAYGKTSDNTLVAGAQYTYRMHKFLFLPAHLTFGMEYNRNNLHDRMLGYGRDMRQMSCTYGGYVQNEWESERLNFVIGARIDKNNRIGNPVFSPRANIRYTPVRNVILRAGYTSGYRAPQAYDEDLHVNAVGGNVSLIVLDPDLKPEYSNSFTLSADLYRNTGKVQLNLLAEGFYTSLDDVFFLEERAPDAEGNLIFMRTNARGAMVRGVNFEAKAALDPDNYVQVGYTYQRSTYKEAMSWSTGASQAKEKRMLRSPDHYGYVSLNGSPAKSLSASVYGTFSGSMLVPHYFENPDDDRLKETPCFFDLGIKLSYDIALTRRVTMQVSGGVKNVLDSFQKDIDRGKTKDAGYIYGPAFPRTFHFGVRFTM